MASDVPDLSGQVAIVTGSARGLGAATARRLAQCGADVVVTYRRNDELAASVAADVRAYGRQAWVYPLDLGDEVSVDGANNNGRYVAQTITVTRNARG